MILARRARSISPSLVVALAAVLAGPAAPAVLGAQPARRVQRAERAERELARPLPARTISAGFRAAGLSFRGTRRCASRQYRRLGTSRDPRAPSRPRPPDKPRDGSLHVRLWRLGFHLS